MECMACGQQTHSPLVRGGALLCATCREAGDTANLRDRITELKAENERLRESYKSVQAKRRAEIDVSTGLSNECNRLGARLREALAEVERLEAEVDRAHEQQDSWRRVAEKTESENLGLRAALAELEEKR